MHFQFVVQARIRIFSQAGLLLVDNWIKTHEHVEYTIPRPLVCAYLTPTQINFLYTSTTKTSTTDRLTKTA